jgi:DNA-binding GntR family transcriptional regulator
VRELKALSLREQAAQVIRAGIIGGELEPGEIYSASVLAARLGVSPTPVREAMLDLANAGLVEAVRNRGFRVLTPDDRDLDEIGELRLMLEVPASRLAAERATDEQLAPLESVVAALESTAEDGDIAGFMLADREFHLGLLELTGNRRLVRLIDQLRDQTRLIGLKELAKAGRLDESAREHRAVLEALQARDADRVEELMRVHIEHTRGIWAGRDEASPADAARAEAAHAS